MRRTLSSLLALVLGVAVLVLTGPSAQAATACSSNVSRTHSTSWRTGTVYVRSCAGNAGYGVVGISDQSVLDLQLRNVSVSTRVYRASDNRQVGISTFYVLEASAGKLWKNYAKTCDGICPRWAGTVGTTYYSVTTVTYDVKDDGRGYFTLTATSPRVRA